MTKNTLSPEAVEHIIHLNACLTEVANWIEERAQLTRSAYFAGGGVEYQQKNGHWEDFELEAIVKCSLAHDAPAFNPDDEYSNLIAAMNGSYTHKYEDDTLHWSDCDSHWGVGLPAMEVFQQTPFCYLFHEIYAHTLSCDLDSLLRIGEIEINLVLTRQRSLDWEAELLPRKRKTSYPRSVFSQRYYHDKFQPLNYRELRYARLLNEKIGEAWEWILAQARRGEQEYLGIEGRERRLMAGNTFDDYEMMMEVSGFLGENHPEYHENDDNRVVSYREPVYKNTQRVFGRGRNIFHYDRYGCYFSPGKFSWTSNLSKINPCGLFWAIFEKTGRDWLKMLSIGGLWLDVFIVQRRIVQV